MVVQGGREDKGGEGCRSGSSGRDWGRALLRVKQAWAFPGYLLTTLFAIATVVCAITRCAPVPPAAPVSYRL